MITDALLQVSAAQVVTASAVSANTIDYGAAYGFDSRGDIWMVFSVDTAVTASGAATVTFQIIGSSSANLSSPTVLAQSDAIGKAELIAGKQIALRLPRWTGLTAAPRYVGANYAVATGPLTGGAFTANVTAVPNLRPETRYPVNQTIV